MLKQEVENKIDELDASYNGDPVMVEIVYKENGGDSLIIENILNVYKNDFKLVIDKIGDQEIHIPYSDIWSIN